MLVLSLLLAAAAPVSTATGITATAASTSGPSALSLERVFSDPPLDGRRPLQAHSSPGGRWVTFLKPSVADSEVLELWGQPLPAGVVYYTLPGPLLVSLGPPPAGHRYVRVATDILLIAIGTGMVVDAIEDIVR